MTAPASPRPLKERQREEREQLILQAAEELFFEQGYHETSIDDIAARVGIAKGTIYLHFASKEDLVLALFERGMRLMLRALDRALSSDGSPREKLRAVIEYVYGSMSGQRFQLMSTMLRSPELLGRLHEKRHLLGDLWEEPMRRVAALLELGKATGEFDPTIPTPVMLSLFGSLLTPQGYHRLVTRDHMPLEDVVHHVSRFFFKGIAAGDGSATQDLQAGTEVHDR
jgi:TetR/AcrR family transcriptional regulator, fatty acid metabolism regulator protein